MVTLTIDGVIVKTDSKKTILQAAQDAGIYIPYLCHSPDLKPVGACRVCMVELEGGKLTPSCKTPVEDSMTVKTETERVKLVRDLALKLVIASGDHSECISCFKNLECKLQEVSAYLGINKEDLERLKWKAPLLELDTSHPLYFRDHNKCVLCGICVRTCEEIVKNSAIDFAFRGIQSKVSTLSDKGIFYSQCVGCGECIVRCPTGALVPKNFQKPNYEVKSICPYCGVGCGIYLGVRGNKVVHIRGDKENDTNEGLLCVKGRFGFEFINHPDRLKKPLIKAQRHKGTESTEFKEASWEEALTLVANKLKEIKEKYGADAIAGLSSAKCTNEDNYLFQKFMRAALGTNNVDHCARLCHGPSVVGLVQAIGSGAMTNTLDQVKDTSEVIFVIGDNPSETHPITSIKIKHALFRGAKLIVADPRKIDLSDIADVYLPQRPGTDVALLQGMAKVIIDEGLQKTDFINSRCENYEEFKNSIEKINLKEVEKITGVLQDKIKEAALLYAKSSASVILWGMGITQHTTGVDNVLMLSNLALLTGQVGREGTGLYPLRGQNNVQGACDMGCLPSSYPCYLPVADENVRLDLEKKWNAKLSPKVGLTMEEMFKSIEEGKIRAMYIMGENPLISSPDINSIKEALKKLDFLVVQDIFLTGTAEFADVVLPAASYAEKDGVFTNSDRKVQRIRKAVEPPGEAKPDREIISLLSKKLGYNMEYEDVSKIMEEISTLSPMYCGINYKRLEQDGICWPCANEDSPGIKTLHEEKFTRGQGKFFAVEFKEAKELPDNEYPLLLTTGRILYQYHGVLTRKVKGLEEISGECLVEINPQDGKKYNVGQGEKIKVTSRRGCISAKAQITDRVLPGTIFVPFHYQEAAANVLTNPELDPTAKMPEFKVAACRIEKG